MIRLACGIERLALCKTYFDILASRFGLSYGELKLEATEPNARPPRSTNQPVAALGQWLLQASGCSRPVAAKSMAAKSVAAKSVAARSVASKLVAAKSVETTRL